MRPSYSPLTIATWIVAVSLVVLFFAVAVVNCASVVDLHDTVTISEGEPLPIDGPSQVRMIMRATGHPAERCDAMNGSYSPATTSCFLILFP